MVFVFWFALAILAGVYANKLNRSGFGYFLLSLFLTPILGFVALLVLGEVKVEILKKPKYFTDEELQQGKLCVDDDLEEVNETMSNIDDLFKLSQLLEKELITKDEFETLKIKLLNS